MRIGVFIIAALWLAPVIAVGAIGIGMPNVPAVLGGAVIACVLAWITSKPLARTLAAALVGRPVLIAAAILVAAVAITLIARESVFMADSTQPRYSLIPGDPWRVAHSCMSGYFEAARFVQAGSDNIYDRGLYQPRQIGALNVDSYHYPPPFLLVPQALRLITTDFFQLRALWFATQALVLGSVVAALGVWIGEVLGAYTLIGGLFFLSAPTVIYSLQMGNFQSTAMALGVLALICLVTRRILVGAFILAYAAISKIFPGLLVVYLLFARRWQAVGWTAAAGLILLALSIGVLGTQPLKDFVHYELPAISDGSAFPQSERLNVAQSNQSMYGLTVRVRHLGATWLDQRTGLRAASLYGLLILGLTAFAGWRSRINLTSPAGRALLVQTSLALMTLASFRSPFVGGPYGLVSTMWLLTLLVATAPTRLYAILWAIAFGVCALGNLLTPSPTYPPTTFWLIASGAIVIAAMAMSVWVVVRPILAAGSSPSPEEDHASGRRLASP